MLKVVQKITEGHLDQKIDVKGRDELAELGHALIICLASFYR